MCPLDRASKVANHYNTLCKFKSHRINLWLAAEVWVENREILSMNHLGEGLPLNNSEWPTSIEASIEALTDKVG